MHNFLSPSTTNWCNLPTTADESLIPWVSCSNNLRSWSDKKADKKSIFNPENENEQNVTRQVWDKRTNIKRMKNFYK